MGEGFEAVIRLPLWQLVTGYAVVTLGLLALGAVALRRTARMPFRHEEDQ